MICYDGTLKSHQKPLCIGTPLSSTFWQELFLFLMTPRLCKVGGNVFDVVKAAGPGLCCFIGNWRVVHLLLMLLLTGTSSAATCTGTSSAATCTLTTCSFLFLFLFLLFYDTLNSQLGNMPGGMNELDPRLIFPADENQGSSDVVDE